MRRGGLVAGLVLLCRPTGGRMLRGIAVTQAGDPGNDQGAWSFVSGGARPSGFRTLLRVYVGD
jgi:hypothetical protein